MFYDAIDDNGKGGGLRELEGATGKEALQTLSNAFDRLNTMRPFDYNAANGWGTNEGALIFLARIMAACALNPRKRVSVSA